jgi:hypothetical protein
VRFAKISAHTSLPDENSKPVSFQIFQEPVYCQLLDCRQSGLFLDQMTNHCRVVAVGTAFPELGRGDFAVPVSARWDGGMLMN